MKLLLIFAAAIANLAAASNIVTGSPALEARNADSNFELAERTMSMNCEASMRRSLSDNIITSRASSTCAVSGHFAHPSKPIFEHRSVSEQRCANSCVCRHAECKSFTWTDNQPVKGRGHCRLYGETFEQMGFTTEEPYAGRTFYSRTCYHKASPSASAVQTTLVARATPPPEKRSAELDRHLMRAMAGI